MKHLKFVKYLAPNRDMSYSSLSVKLCELFGVKDILQSFMSNIQNNGFKLCSCLWI